MTRRISRHHRCIRLLLPLWRHLCFVPKSPSLVFVSLALCSNAAALPFKDTRPWAQDECEEHMIRITSSPHLKELIRQHPKYGIMNIERVSVDVPTEKKCGYDVIRQYKVSALCSTQQGLIERDITVYVVHSKKPLTDGVSGPVAFGLVYEDNYVEDPEAGQSGYVNEAKADPKGPARIGSKAPKKFIVFPPWREGEIEPPLGQKDVGRWIEAVYTPEQQARLEVDEYGRRLSTPSTTRNSLGQQ